MSVRPTVSVVIPTFEGSGTLERALHSLLTQRLRPHEVIIVDDGSSSEEQSLLRSWLPQAFGELAPVLILLPHNQGPGAARNAGWDVAKGEFIAFLDADDKWHPNKLQIQADYLSAHPSTDLLGAQSGPIEKAQREVRNVKLWSQLIHNNFVTSSVLLRRSVPLRFHESRRMSEDNELWLRMAASGYELACQQSVLCSYSGGSDNHAGLSSKHWAFWVAQLDVYRDAYRDHVIGLHHLGVAWLSSGARFLLRLLRLLLRSRNPRVRQR